MAKQKKFKKIQVPKVQWVGIAVFIVFVVSAWLLITAFLGRSDYFKLRSVEFKGATDKSLAAAKNEILACQNIKNGRKNE